ncbi:MAG: hypothetical protein J7463_05975 [Roseiflexus sp.]|nr:hypothetical protein [Roseiflexus sp.]MBO9342839.1 hypothetical protein [Roseiflexus sp.]
MTQLVRLATFVLLVTGSFLAHRGLLRATLMDGESTGSRRKRSLPASHIWARC